jgi:hypothetical protein
VWIRFHHTCGPIEGRPKHDLTQRLRYQRKDQCLFLRGFKLCLSKDFRHRLKDSPRQSLAMIPIRKMLPAPVPKVPIHRKVGTGKAEAMVQVRGETRVKEVELRLLDQTCLPVALWRLAYKYLLSLLPRKRCGSRLRFRRLLTLIPDDSSLR